MEMTWILFVVGLVAASVVASSADKSPAYPLFEYEKSPLTERSLPQLLKGAGARDLASLFAFDDESDASTNPVAEGACKAFPGDASWPSERTWKTLNKLIGGALIETVPIAASCYRNLGVYDAEKCAAVRNSWSSPYFQ